MTQSSNKDAATKYSSPPPPPIKTDIKGHKRPRSEVEEICASQPPRKKTATATHPVKFLVISDTHDLDLTDDPSSAYRLPTPQVDVVLHCGDLTENGTHANLDRALRDLGAIPAELKLVIAGNHEITLDHDFYASQGGKKEDHDAAVALMTGPLADAHGVTFLGEGTRTFTLCNGATFTIYASPYTPQYGESAFQYPSAQDRFNPPEAGITPEYATNVATHTSTIPEGVDIVMTHGPPKYILDDTEDGRSAGCEHLRRAIHRVKPRLHCFGHVHRGYGAQRVNYVEGNAKEGGGEEDGMECLPKEFVGKNQARRKGYASLSPASADAFRDDGRQGLMVNAAIMDAEGKPGNAPWLVGLELCGGREREDTGASNEVGVAGKDT